MEAGWPFYKAAYKGGNNLVKYFCQMTTPGLLGYFMNHVRLRNQESVVDICISITVRTYQNILDDYA